MTSILDEALEGEIEKHHGRMPKKYSKTLGDRISFASDNNMINNGDNLHDVRGRRNDTAHEISATVIWDELEADSFEIEMALQNLNLVGNRPEFDITAERSALQGSDDSRIAYNCDYSVKVKRERKLQQNGNGADLHTMFIRITMTCRRIKLTATRAIWPLMPDVRPLFLTAGYLEPPIK